MASNDPIGCPAYIRTPPWHAVRGRGVPTTPNSVATNAMNDSVDGKSG